MRKTLANTWRFLPRAVCVAGSMGLAALSVSASAVDLLLHNGQFYAEEGLPQCQRPGFVMDCMKIQFDGVPTSAKTAVMLEPYERQADEVETLGLISYPREQIIANVVCWDALGLTVKMHAAGDGAVRIAVDAVEAAREANGNSGLMHDVFHISFADRNDFARMRDLGGALEFSPYRCNLQPIVNDIRYAVGEQRMQGWIPLRDGMDSGALVIDVPSTVLHRTRAELVFLHRELEYRANSP